MYKITLAGADAHRSLEAIKGSSGIKPCLSCANVMGRCEEYEDFVSDGFTMHVLSPAHDSFVPHTHASVTEMANALQDMKDIGVGPIAIKEREIIYGINYCQDGALFDERCRNIIQSPEDVYWDSQYCLFSSGGVAQYHLNGLLRVFTANGVSIIDIYEWLFYSLRDAPPTHQR